MDIVLLANYSATSLSGYVHRALKMLGHKVVFVSPQLVPEDSLLCEPVLDVPDFLIKHNLRPDLLVVVESSVHPLLVPLNLEKLKCVTAWWAIDNHINYRWHKEFAAFFDYVFFAQKDFTHPASAYSGRNISWLPLACDPSIHVDKHLNRTIDCGFVGNMNKYREEYFSKLKTQTDLQIVNGLDPFQMADYYNTCRSVFNISMRCDLNMRTFEAMACGSLLITQNIKNGLTDLFKPGVNIATHNLDDAAEVINYYRVNPEKAASIAKSGHELVIKEHTYEKRMETIIDLSGGGKKGLFSEEILSVRKHFVFDHRHFTSLNLNSKNEGYKNISLLKKLKYKTLFFLSFLWQKKYLMKVKKFG